MNITTVSYKNAPDKALAKKLYLTSFPKEELIPWWIVLLLINKKCVNFNCHYENGHFCGFTFTANEGNVLFVLFFAIEENLRHKGYGSAILEHLKSVYPNCEIYLNVELLDENADNFNERVKRVEFYKKNGFFDTKHNIREVGGVFRVLATTKDISPDDYIRVFKKMSFGLWTPKIWKANN